MIVTNLHKSQICIENFDGDCKEQAPNEYLPHCLWPPTGHQMFASAIIENKDQINSLLQVIS